jgi:hypothetical protein
VVDGLSYLTELPRAGVAHAVDHQVDVRRLPQRIEAPLVMVEYSTRPSW